MVKRSHDYDDIFEPSVSKRSRRSYHKYSKTRHYIRKARSRHASRSYRRKASIPYRKNSMLYRILRRYERIGRAEKNAAEIGGLIRGDASLGRNDEGPITADSYVNYLVSRGRGAYDIGGAIGRGVGGAIGSRFGNRKAGRQIGGILGRAAQTYVGGGGYRAYGMGAYNDGSLTNVSGSNVSTNSLIAGSSSSVPVMTGGDEIGSVCVTHRECLGAVTGSEAFENTIFNLNPGLKSCFPFLSQIAVNYREYEFVQLQFVYISLLSEVTSSGTVGNIIITTDYNAGATPYTSSIDMLNNIGTNSARPIDGPIIHGVECDPNKNVMGSLFVRSGSVPAGQDPKTYDVGLTQLATEGMPNDGQIVGQWWVTYSVILRKPMLYVSAGKNISNDYIKYDSDGTTNMLNTCLGVIGKACPANNIGVQLRNTGAMQGAVIFPPGVVQGLFKISFRWLNPLNQAGAFPGSSQLVPTWALYNMVVDNQSTNAHYLNPLLNGPQMTYNSSTYAGNELALEMVFFVKLLGSFAVDTQLQFDFPSYADAKFTFDAFQFSCEQVNPLPLALTTTNPAEWNPIVNAA